MKIKVTKKISKIRISVFYTLYILSIICIIKRIQPLEEELEEAHGIVSCDRLNLRKDPFEKFGNVIETLARGTELVIEPSTLNDEWCKVYTSVGISGYCKREFISVIE